MLRFIVFILLVTNVLWAFSQKKCRPIRHPEAKKLVVKGKRYISSYPEKALRDLKASLRFEGTNADVHYLLAGLYQNKYFRSIKQEKSQSEIRKQRQATEKHYNLAIKFCPSFLQYESYFRLGSFYYQHQERQKARDFLQIYTNHSQGQYADSAKHLLKAIDVYFYLIKNPVEFTPRKIASVSTSDMDEYLPQVSPDGQYLFFTRRSEQKIRAGNRSLSEAFLFSKKADSTDYGRGKYMPLPFNDGRNQGGVSVTINNKTMFVTICSNVYFGSSAYKNCDIYETNFINGHWSRPTPLGEAINGRHSFEAQPSVTADGNTLYFVSIRKGGHGRMDIYSSTRNKYGKWSKAKNLGPTINTPLDDKTPFIHTDGQTLYFASKGHLGVGGFDIFYARKENELWQKPKNIGFPINTEEDNLGMVLSSNGKHLYFASRHLSDNKQYDIFTSKLYPEARPKRILFLRGSIQNTKGHGLSEASVELENLKTKVKKKGLVDETTGEYAIAVPSKKTHDYTLTVQRKGYVFRSEYINPNQPRFDSVSVHNFKIPKIKKGITVQLDNIYFEFDSDKFNYKSRVSLNNFLRFLENNTTLRVKILGHTDNAGSTQYNQNLSAKRAKAVERYLLKNGIVKTRLRAIGVGESKPVATNKTAEGRAKNRRTEFEIF